MVFVFVVGILMLKILEENQNFETFGEKSKLSQTSLKGAIYNLIFFLIS